MCRNIQYDKLPYHYTASEHIAYSLMTPSKFIPFMVVLISFHSFPLLEQTVEHAKLKIFH